MHSDSSALRLVAEPRLDAARQVFLAASHRGASAEPMSDGRAGPGWFESSRELRDGLVVTEATADADLWSALYRAPLRPASLRTARPRSITAIA